MRDSVEAVRHPFMESSEAAGSDPDVPWKIAALRKTVAGGWSRLRLAFASAPMKPAFFGARTLRWWWASSGIPAATSRGRLEIHGKVP